MMRELKDKVVILAGAAGGIGRAVAENLAKHGVKLALFARDPAQLREMEAMLQAETLCCRVDVTCEAQVAAAMEAVQAQLGTPEILINLAGISIPAKVWEMTEESYDRTMDANLKGTFLCTKHFARMADPALGGQIINISSMASKRANGNAPMYCTAKAAVSMFSSGMAIQLKERNIRVTALNPGGVDSPFWGDRPVDRTKFLQVEDVAEVIEFILTRNSYVSFCDVSFESFLSL